MEAGKLSRLVCSMMTKFGTVVHLNGRMTTYQLAREKGQGGERKSECIMSLLAQ